MCDNRSRVLYLSRGMDPIGSMTSAVGKKKDNNIICSLINIGEYTYIEIKERKTIKEPRTRWCAGHRTFLHFSNRIGYSYFFEDVVFVEGQQFAV